MTTVIGIILLVAAGAAAFKVTAFVVRIILGIVAFIGLMIIVVPLLIVSS